MIKTSADSGGPSSAWTTWANLLTLLRSTSIPASTLSILYTDWTIAAAILCLAIVSDIYDGKLARHFNQASPLGGLLDHLTDAVFVATGCWALAQTEVINGWLCWLILLAFFQYMLDSKALSGKALRTSQLGRLNGIAYFVVLGAAVGAQVLRFEFLMPVVETLAWALVGTTIASMADRALTLIRLRNSGIPTD